MLNKIIDFYENLELITPVQVKNTSQFNTPVNFKQSKTVPRHRWFTYKEGFSPFFVEDFINLYSSKKDNVIFDPFGGIGTTVLEAGLKGYQSYSNDINPMSNYIAKIKTRNYSNQDVELIEQLSFKMIKDEFIEKVDSPANKTVVKYFNDENLDFILRAKHWIENIKIKHIKSLFDLALLSSLEEISTHKKDGNGVKRKKNFQPVTDDPNLKQILLNKINIYIEDILKTKIVVKPKIHNQSSFESYTFPSKVDLVLTSPPYANCFDYSKIYLIELWFGGFFKQKEDQIKFRNSSVTSHVHYKWDNRHEDYCSKLVNDYIQPYLITQELWNRNIPRMLVGYFSDLGKVLHEMKANLNPGAKIGFVVGNSVYAGVPIATDMILADLAQVMGYQLIGVESYRFLTPSSQQMSKIKEEHKKYLRESLVILQWN
ncbi:Adenine-specific DNA methylase [Legionella pneumophila]|uniref:DNA adenine methylase n=1 Tax=Legionella pneumophila TaxID=446 RepID=UPI000770ABC0|nr:DNA adenine methylase [Legionella pneumophila]MDI9824480.1 DNA adenine methylase [Legionella pneumophila]CZP77139.1 Adenine-specific DNA methylase [Legionella pneumophila]HDV5821453.1 DNA adenine methylase [Legionella pneumophila]